jgi:hypothetical protein
MIRTLSDDDSRAVDLLLDRGNSLSGEKTTGSFVTPGGIAPKRVEAAEKILGMLQFLPAADPPTDLLSKTMHSVDQAIRALEGAPISADQKSTGSIA